MRDESINRGILQWMPPRPFAKAAFVELVTCRRMAHSCTVPVHRGKNRHTDTIRRPPRWHCFGSSAAVYDSISLSLILNCLAARSRHRCQDSPAVHQGKRINAESITLFSNKFSVAMRLLFHIVTSAVDAAMNTASATIRCKSFAQVFPGPVEPDGEVVFC